MIFHRVWPVYYDISHFANLLPNWTLLPILNLLPNFRGFHRTLQRVRLANRGRLLLRTPDAVLFGTCICSNVETILSWTCHVYGPFEFRTSLGTSILLWTISTQHNTLNLPINKDIVRREKGRDQTQFFDKSPVIHRKSKKQRDNTKTLPETSITQLLGIHIRRSIVVTKAVKLVSLNRFRWSKP